MTKGEYKLSVPQKEGEPDFPALPPVPGREGVHGALSGRFPEPAAPARALSLSLGGGARPAREFPPGGQPSGAGPALESGPGRLRASGPLWFSQRELPTERDLRGPAPHGHLPRNRVSAPSAESPVLIAAAEHGVRVSAEWDLQQAELQEGV